MSSVCTLFVQTLAPTLLFERVQTLGPKLLFERCLNGVRTVSTQVTTRHRKQHHTKEGKTSSYTWQPDKDKEELVTVYRFTRVKWNGVDGGGEFRFRVVDASRCRLVLVESAAAARIASMDTLRKTTPPHATRPSRWL